MFAVGQVFSRGQVGEITKIPDDVLSYWMRDGLLRSSGPTAERKHRRFDVHQVTIAAILAEVRTFGANIGFLRSLASAFQHGAKLADGSGLNPYAITDAIELASLLHRHAAGGEVVIFTGDKPPYANEVARTPQQIVDYFVRFDEDVHGDTAAIVDFGRSLLPADLEPLSLFVDLSHNAYRYLWDRGNGEQTQSNPGDMTWIIAGTDPLRIFRSPEGSEPFGRGGDDVRSGLYLSPGVIFRQLWQDQLEQAVIHEPPRSEEVLERRRRAAKRREEVRARLARTEAQQTSGAALA